MIKILDVLNICNGELISGNENLICKNFSMDTRKINKGDIYIGIKGSNFNGNNFYKEALEKGAVACILDNDTVLENTTYGTIVLVDDTIKAIQELAKYKRSLYDIPVVAVTGSVGKTSVKDMVYKVLSSEYNVLCTKGNLNNHIGLPLTILGLDKHDAMILEMGMNHQGELHILSNIAKPDVAIITNIGTAHIGNLGSRENILKAKLEILDGMIDGALIINNDNDLLRTVKYDNLITVGIDNDSDYMAKEINDNVFSANFYIDDEYIQIPVGSKAFVYNALFAYAVGKKLGVSTENIIKSLESFKLTPHRLEVIENDNFTIIDDTYNASLDSVKNSLSLLAKVKTRKVFVFGDILELDEFAEEIHKEIGKFFLEEGIDVLITVGIFSRYTHDVVFDGGKEVHHFDNNDKLFEEIDDIIDHGDTVLIKGSHAMNLVDVVNYLKNS